MGVFWTLAEKEGFEVGCTDTHRVSPMDEKDDAPDIGDGNTQEEEKEKTNEMER